MINPSTTAATVTLKLRNVTGEVALTATQSIPAKGQIAFTLNQVFTATASGWFSADIDVDQVTGLWMAGDFVNSTDGAPLLNPGDAIAFPWFTYFTSASEVSFANVGSTTLTGSLVLKNASGQSIASKTFSVAPFAIYQSPVSTLFPTQAASLDTDAHSIIVNSSSSAAKVIGTTLTPNAGGDNIATNLANVSYKDFVFPHIVGGALGGASYTTMLTLTNFQSTSTTVSLTLTQTSGASITVDKTIPGQGAIRSSVTSLFGLTTVDGWLQVTSPDFVGGLVTYTDNVSGGSTAVQMQGVGDSNLIFGHIADLSPWWTGVALANPSNVDAQVEVFAFNPAGDLIGGPAQSANAAFTLPARSKTAFLLGNVVPQTQTRTSDGGYVYIRSVNGVQLYGIELFFLRSGRVYSNVAATRLGTLTYTPPGTITSGISPATGGTVTITQVYASDSDGTRKQSFRTGDAFRLNMGTSNTTGAAASPTRTYRAGSGSYTLSNATFSSAIVAGRGIYWASGTIPSNAPPGLYTFTGTIDWNGVVSTLTTTFRVESNVVIAGRIFQGPTEAYPFELPLPGATILIVANNQNYTTTADSNANYSITLPIALRDQVSQVIMQVTAPGFLPKGVPVDLSRGSQTVNVTLELIGTSVVVDTGLHHLGDGIFTTTFNLGLQLSTTEGLSYSRTFTIPGGVLPPNQTEAVLVVTVNGAETYDPVMINGTMVTGLNNSMVGPQTYYYPFDIGLLRLGSNTITIQANPDTFNGYDDFEFSNVYIRFKNPAILKP